MKWSGLICVIALIGQSQAAMLNVVETFSANDLAPGTTNGIRALTVVDQTLWMSDGNGGTLYSHHLISGQKQTFSTCPFIDSGPYCLTPGGLAYDGSKLWMSSGSSLIRMDPDTGIPSDYRGNVKNLDTGQGVGASALTWDGEFIWIGDFGDYLHKFDPTSNQVVESIALDWYFITWGITAVGDYLLISQGNPPGPALHLFDPVTNQIVETWDGLPIRAEGMAFDGRYVWMADGDQDTAYGEGGTVYKMELPGLSAYVSVPVANPFWLVVLGLLPLAPVGALSRKAK